MDYLKFSKDETSKIKGLAILLMFVHHFYFDADFYSEFNLSFYPFTESFSHRLALAMKICVSLFVFLTGYGMTMSYQKKYNNNIKSDEMKDNVRDPKSRRV